MTTTVVLSFRDVYYPSQVRGSIHLVHHTDHFPHDTNEVMLNLADVANKIWKGEAPDLARLKLPHADRVFRRDTLAAACRYGRVPWRYEIDLCNERIVRWTELRHEPKEISKLEEAIAPVAEVTQEARRACTYRVTRYGYYEDLKK